jgi:hypothetical protein
MKWEVVRRQWFSLLLITLIISISACSTQQHQTQDEIAVNSADPFADPFFTQPPAWDDSVLQQSEVLADKPDEPEKPKTMLERSEGIVLSTLIVGVSLAKMALPFMGF